MAANSYFEMYKVYLEKVCHLIPGKDGNLYRGLYKYEPHVLRTQAFCLRRIPGAPRRTVKEEIIDLDRLKRWYMSNVGEVAG